MEVKLERLRAEIARLDELYFKKAAPEISDEAYDRLRRELTELERAERMDRRVEIARETHAGAEAAGDDSAHGERVGDDRSGRFPTARHGARMMSLAKVYTEAELRAFVRRVEKDAGGTKEGRGINWVIEPKYDGLAVSATYERGRLVRLVTRGNGIDGDEVTGNARAIDGLAEQLAGENWPEKIEIRGEVFVGFAEFARVNAERAAAGETLFANPRVLAAGSLKSTDSGEVRARGLSVVFYGWGEVRPEGARTKTQSGFHAQVRVWGLPGVTAMKRVKTWEEVRGAVRAFARERAELAFPTDGVVIKLDEVEARENVGATDHAPRWAVAYKFTAERARTRVMGITVQVGRSGVLTPVAELEPVTLGGSVVTRATLHNAAEIARLDVRVGDIVSVEKAGEIIPAVVAVDFAARDGAGGKGAEGTEETRRERFVFPEDCPVCGAAVVARTEDGVRQYCANRECPAQVAARLIHFAGASGVAIRGMGEATIDALVTAGKLKDVADIYRLTRGDLEALPGFGARSAEKLLAAIEAGRRPELWRLIHGLGIPRTGVATSRILAGKFGSLEELAKAGEAELTSIKGVGAAQAEAIAGFFKEPENRRLITELRACGVEPRRGGESVESGGREAAKGGGGGRADY